MSQKEVVNALRDSAPSKVDTFEVDGVKVLVKPVSSLLIQEVVSHIKDPEIPLSPNPDKEGRMDENPFDPAYVKALREAQTKRANATTDTLIMFGLELVDGLPKNDLWLQKLRKLEKMGLLDLTGIDFDDQFDKEFAFKKFIAGTNPMIMEVTRSSGVSKEDIDVATDSFQGNAAQ